MKFVLAVAAALALGFGAVSLSGIDVASAGPPDVIRPCPDGNCFWPPGQNRVKVKRNIAVKLCVAMARSGAYTDLDDNQFSDFCIKVASHLGDSVYDHTD